MTHPLLLTVLDFPFTPAEPCHSIGVYSMGDKTV